LYVTDTTLLPVSFELLMKTGIYLTSI
jgi:hypothetical protein